MYSQLYPNLRKKKIEKTGGGKRCYFLYVFVSLMIGGLGAENCGIMLRVI